MLGLNPGSDRDELRGRLGGQLQDAELSERLRVGEALRLYSSFYAAPADWRALIEMLGLTGKEKTQFASCLAASGSGCPSRQPWSAGRRWSCWTS